MPDSSYHILIRIFGISGRRSYIFAALLKKLTLALQPLSIYNNPNIAERDQALEAGPESRVKGCKPGAETSIVRRPEDAG
jgi:hypothetical protein